MKIKIANAAKTAVAKVKAWAGENAKKSTVTADSGEITMTDVPKTKVKLFIEWLSDVSKKATVTVEDEPKVAKAAPASEPVKKTGKAKAEKAEKPAKATKASKAVAEGTQSPGRPITDAIVAQAAQHFGTTVTRVRGYSDKYATIEEALADSKLNSSYKAFLRSL